MISLEAIVRPERINQVTDALLAAGCSGFYYYNVTGQGEQGSAEVIVGRAGPKGPRSSVPQTVIRVVVADDLQDKVVAAITESSTGNSTIFISNVTSP